MDRGLSSFLKTWLYAALALFACTPAHAQETTRPACHAYSDALITTEQALQSLDWTCSEESWENGRAVSWLRFSDWDRAAPPRVFASRITVFDSATIAAIDADGTVREVRHTSADATPVMAGPVFVLPLPELTDTTREVVVALDRPHSVTAASEGRLEHDPENAEDALHAMLLLAMITGMLVMPMLFDSLFFIVLRERFVLLHAGITLSMLTYVLTSGGVLTAFVALPVDWLARIGPLAWAAGIGLSGLFALAFLERDAIPAPLRRTLRLVAWWVMLVPGFCALQLPITQSFDNTVYFLAFAPILPFIGATLLYALARGSRAAGFLTAAWAPVMLASFERLLRGIGVYAAPDSFDRLLFVALAFEVSIVALAIADRFIAIRRERDLARTEAREMEELTERDALTGLLNRRGLERSFHTLRLDGFTTLAVIDLDHFKAINDDFGHLTGDEVLRRVATTLRGDDHDSRVFRLGGEEFLLLLRGAGALARADEKRRSITRAVAADNIVPRRVTASMGLVEVPVTGVQDTEFAELYQRADRLLYEAKTTGRDRTMSERVKVFSARREERREQRQAERRVA